MHHDYKANPDRKLQSHFQRLNPTIMLHFTLRFLIIFVTWLELRADLCCMSIWMPFIPHGNQLRCTLSVSDGASIAPSSLYISCFSVIIFSWLIYGLIGLGLDQITQPQTLHRERIQQAPLSTQADEILEQCGGRKLKDDGPAYFNSNFIENGNGLCT